MGSSEVMKLGFLLTSATVSGASKAQEALMGKMGQTGRTVSMEPTG